MKVFTLSQGSVETGACVEKINIASKNIQYFGIGVGEHGRGRKYATLPVHEKACKKNDSQLIVFEAELGKTKMGKPKIFPQMKSSVEECIVVLRTHIGFRGGNKHTGDIKGWDCFNCAKNGDGPLPETCPHCGWKSTELCPIQPQHTDFPGTILVEGIIAQGEAGNMGNGKQLIAVVQKGVVFRTAYSGRLYGQPDEHFYLFNGETVLAVTWQERCESEIF